MAKQTLSSLTQQIQHHTAPTPHLFDTTREFRLKFWIKLLEYDSIRFDRQKGQLSFPFSFEISSSSSFLISRRQFRQYE
jgi:hypothetical protein